VVLVDEPTAACDAVHMSREVSDNVLCDHMQDSLRSETVKSELLIVGVIAFASLCWGLTLNGGFQGYDDLHYLQAALNWLHDGPSLPTDHWSGRLPYVLLLALGVKLFGANEGALIVVNSILFVSLIVTLWFVARLKFGSGSALFAAGLAATTPLFFRSPLTFYPETLETTLFGIELGLIILATRKSGVERSTVLLIVAGLFGGTALVLRATSAVIPLALSVFILLEIKRPRTAFLAVATLALGYVIPLMAEALYYFVMTGNPIYRYVIDSKDGVVNQEMVGEVIITRDALFNIGLAKLWTTWAPAVFKIHWTVNHMVNVFATPSLLLTPYFGLAGIITALRSEKFRNFALLSILLLGLQYAIFTFVFVLSPTPRYYDTSIFLFCILGGLFLSSSVLLARNILLLAQVLLGIMIGLTQIGPRSIVDALFAAHKRVTPIYISSATADASYVSFLNDASLAEAVRVGFPPVGAYALIGWDGWPRDTLKHTCSDGGLQWDVTFRTSNPSLLWKLLDTHFPKIASILPDRISGYLRRDVENTALARRRC
jgi:Dolichyl-phosphate-mannose-protein mannosyltransferase